MEDLKTEREGETGKEKKVKYILSEGEKPSKKYRRSEVWGRSGISLPWEILISERPNSSQTHLNTACFFPSGCTNIAKLTF